MLSEDQALQRVHVLAAEKQMSFADALSRLRVTDPELRAYLSHRYQTGASRVPEPPAESGATERKVGLSVAMAVPMGLDVASLSGLDAYRAIIQIAMKLWRDGTAASPGHGLELAVKERPDLAARAEADPPSEDDRHEVLTGALLAGRTDAH